MNTTIEGTPNRVERFGADAILLHISHLQIEHDLEGPVKEEDLRVLHVEIERRVHHGTWRHEVQNEYRGAKAVEVLESYGKKCIRTKDGVAVPEADYDRRAPLPQVVGTFPPPPC